MRKIFNLILIVSLSILYLLTSCTSMNGQQSNNQQFSENLEYKLNDDGESYTVVGFGDWQGLELIIPNEHNGLPVTSIEEGAFMDDYYLNPFKYPEDLDYLQHTVKITKVVIPDTIKTIGPLAFFNCIYLETVILPDSIESIKSGTFFGCISLKNINIPNSVKTIEGGAFAACKSLVNIHIPESVTSIENVELPAFMGCMSLACISVAKENQYYTSIENNLYSKDEKSFIQYALGQKNDTFTIPNTVENIAMCAFRYCNTLKQINLSPSMTKINEYAFSHCYSLTNVSIPLSVDSIEQYAFEGCFSLTSITIPESVTNVSDSAFDNCYSLFEIYNKSSAYIYANEHCRIIENKSDSYLKYIEDFIFYDDGSEVYLIKYLGDETEITLPQYGESLPYGIYDYTFYDTIKNYYQPILSILMAGGNSKITSVIIPDYVTSIGKYAFSGCSLLEEIFIPQSVTKVGEFAFVGCTSLTIYCETEPNPTGWENSWNQIYPYRLSLYIQTFCWTDKKE